VTNTVFSGTVPGHLMIEDNALAHVISGTFSNSQSTFGRGIRNAGQLWLMDGTVSNNSSLFAGAGIFNSGQMWIETTSVFGNQLIGGASGQHGAGIYNAGVMTITNSTIFSNSANATGLSDGGGIANSGTLLIASSTLFGKSAASGMGGGLQIVSGSVTVRNSIVAGSVTSTDCSITVGVIIDDGNNLVQDNSCGLTGGTDPLLGQLQNNGGPTLTHALLPGSPAIDAGNPAGCTDAFGNLLTTDQRGFIRPAGGRCDIGAFEYGATAFPRVFLPVLVR
jgi:hypothetical protein